MQSPTREGNILKMITTERKEPKKPIDKPLEVTVLEQAQQIDIMRALLDEFILGGMM